ncbi:MAG: hypothetical protein CVV50_03580 [Spirochaetae bacterium HGW-Spirochaetae-6]|nr:MAG: hypothetical protein CVV50_03580 [Spirochaetae bacterium HGW-Spirochaetae-6]
MITEIQSGETDINEHIQKNCVTLISFYADWGGPWQHYSKLLKQSAEDHPEAEFVQINVESNKILCAKFQVTRVPTTLFYKNGVLLFTKTGLIKRLELMDTIQRLVS